MKILVTGGSGFIGSFLVRELLKAGNDVRILDKEGSHYFNNLVIRGDVRDRDVVKRAVQNVDIIYHLAAEHRDDVRPVSLYYKVNVDGANNIIQAADDHGIRKIIFTSTVAVYGLTKENPDEHTPAEPFNDYGKSKLEAEKVFSSWGEQAKGRTLVTVRPVVIFGEGNQGNVFTLINQIARNKFIIVGKGNNKKSMGYIGNIVNFLIKALEFREGIHLFNYADKPDMTVEELVKYIKTELRIKKNIPSVPYVVGMTGGYIFDMLSFMTSRKFSISSVRIKKFCANTTVATQALDEIGFRAPFSLKHGLKRMIEDFKISHRTSYL